MLYSFSGGADGASPEAGLVQDATGNLYGTTIGANSYPYGKITGTTAGSLFKLSPGGNFTLLYNFGVGGANGAAPAGGLVKDSADNLYGSTSGGGASTNPSCFAGGNQFPLDGCGEVFKVDASGNFSVLYSFSGKTACWDGCAPLAPLTIDAVGNLYGTTQLGGSGACDEGKVVLGQNSDCGVVFKLDTNGKEIVVHRFGSARKYGDNPNSGLIMDAAGNLYGTTKGGGPVGPGSPGAGTVFKLDADGDETVLHFFSWYVDGGEPGSGLIQDAAGNFYGTTELGLAFRLDPEGSLTKLAGLGGSSFAPLIMDAAGNFYGTTYSGGNINPVCDYGDGCGTVFKLDPSGNETVLYSFSGGKDGANPLGGLTIDMNGNLYGTATYGGKTNKACPSGCGVVFKITL